MQAGFSVEARGMYEIYLHKKEREIRYEVPLLTGDLERDPDRFATNHETFQTSSKAISGNKSTDNGGASD